MRYTLMVVVICLLVIAMPALAFPVDVHYQSDGFAVTAPAYEMRFDLTHPGISEFKGKAGTNQLIGPVELFIRDDSGREFRSSLSKTPALLHPVRIGRYFSEVTVGNIVLAGATGDEWPGLGEITFYLHPDRVYVRFVLICNDGEWQRTDMVVYRTLESHRDCPDVTIREAGMRLGFAPDGQVHALVPEGEGLVESPAIGLQSGLWEKGSRHEGSLILVPGARDEAERALDQERHPLPPSAFKMSRGSIKSYNCGKGVYELIAKDTDTDRPPHGYYGGCTYTVTCDDQDRRILVEQSNNWGGLRGAIIRDGDGNPLPIRTDIAVNFPELRVGGENDWGFVTYPLALKPGESRSLMADHLYLGYGRNSQILLMSLENVGSPPLLQTSVDVVESHTVTTGVSPGKTGVLKFNDFRTHKIAYGGNRSASSVLPSFFQYLDPAGVRHQVVPDHVDIAFEGPVYTEYTIIGYTDDRKVRVTLRVVQMPSDITRVFSFVNVEFLEDTAIDASRKSNVRFINNHTFNPMVFLKYAYTAENGSVKLGNLDVSGEIKEDGTPLGEKPFVQAYYAPNGLEQGIPCSDITGNPGFLLRHWDATINGQSARPGLYVFTAKDIPSGGDWSRDLAVVPTQQFSAIKAGSRIEYSVESFVYGDSKSDYAQAALERKAFGLDGPKLEVTVGEKTGDFLPEMRARDGAAEFRIAGGIGKLAVRVDGFPTANPIRLLEKSGDGWQPVEQGLHGNDWYQCHENAGGDIGFIFLAETGKTYRVGQPAASTANKPKPVLPPAPDGVIIEQDIPYLAPDRQETLDLYLPADRPKDARSPAVVMIHGGGWVGGDKAEYRSFNVCTTLALAGYVCVSINYTLERGKCWPTDLYDCKNAVRWLRVNAEKYGIDSDHIGVIGGSAGGHLALMVAYTNRVPKLEPASPYPLVSDRVSCVVNMYGITNLLTRRKTDGQGNPTGERITATALMPKPVYEDRDAWGFASPVYHISKSSPATLILHGMIDTTVDRDQASELDRKLAEYAVERQLIMIEGIGHTFDLQTWAKKPLPQDLRPVVIGFFDKHLKR